MESSGLQTVSLPSAQGRRALTWRGMSVITGILVSAPIVAGLVTHSIRETPAMGPVFWAWMVLSVCCLWWARYALRRFRLLGWSCMAIDLLQMALFVIVFLTVDFPENARSQPDTQQHNVNSHNW
jgi:hypothetical protein